MLGRFLGASVVVMALVVAVRFTIMDPAVPNDFASSAGDGTIVTQLSFMPDVEVTCPACKGRRYREETLEVIWRGRNIAEVLKLCVIPFIIPYNKAIGLLNIAPCLQFPHIDPAFLPPFIDFVIPAQVVITRHNHTTCRGDFQPGN